MNGTKGARTLSFGLEPKQISQFWLPSSYMEDSRAVSLFVIEGI